ncbi:hypothetical protein [Paenibacillus sp. TH7-28]
MATFRIATLEDAQEIHALFHKAYAPVRELGMTVFMKKVLNPAFLEGTEHS